MTFIGRANERKQGRGSGCGASATARYGLAGAFFGCAFPLGATVVDVLAHGEPITLRNLAAIQAATPLHWIIDTAPVFLGVFAAFAGRREDRLCALNDELESRVAARTGSLARSNEDLEAARARAEQADRSKSEFLANMSHEIRTPMNGVIGLTALLADTPLTTDQQAYVASIQSSGTALLAIINDILDFSKIEAGRLEIEAIDFDLHGALEDVIQLLDERAATKGVQLGVLMNGDVPEYVNGDPGRVRQVLLNLVGNAIKFTEQGSVTVRVTRQPESLVQFDVEDSGVGIAPDALPRLFEMFTQADASTTRRFGGTGLGLAICRRLTALMGGTITVESQLGVGSTFTFTASLPERPAPKRSTVADRRLEGLQALVVADSPLGRESLSSQLRRLGLEVTTCASPDAASRLPHPSADYDVILVDAAGSTPNALSTCDQLKTTPALRGVPVVLLTMAGQPGDANRAAEAGCLAYLTKPVRREQLQRCLQHIVGLPQQSDESRPLITKYTLREAAAQEQPRILVADDNRTNQLVAIKLLEKLGCRVSLASNGREAVDAMLADRSYDLVFMDCQMPVMDGFEAVARIKEQLTPCPPIVALTANAMAGDRERCLAAGMDDYLPKPITSAALSEVLNRWSPARKDRSLVPVTAD